MIIYFFFLSTIEFFFDKYILKIDCKMNYIFLVPFDPANVPLLIETSLDGLT